MYFTCPDCGRAYGDPLYHGPDGHAPPQMCFDCWAAHWDRTEVLLRAERGNWRRMDVALFLICQGHSRTEVAGRIGVARNTLARWIAGLRKKPHKIPDWLRNRGSEISERPSMERRR